MSPKPDVSEERKNQILDSATKVFVEYGFGNARMDDIVAESGLSKGALYWYFKGKDEIISGILNRFASKMFDNMESILDTRGDPLEKLNQITTWTIKELQLMRPLMPLLIDFYSLGLRNKSVRNVIKPMLHRFVSMAVPVIDEGIETGLFTRVDSTEAALTIGAVLEGTLLLWSFDQDIMDMELQLEMGMKLVIRGLMASGNEEKNDQNQTGDKPE
ncbi:MAG: TetR/AcrR family transcriptional regulator [Anaerolineaceae bacterium]|nr:TetR/AcrR family transcriptional regulator [Anaerolineaceae bacterium]